MPTSPRNNLFFTGKSGSTANYHKLRMHTLGTTLNCSWCAIGQHLPSFIALTNDVYALSKLTVTLRGFPRGFTWLYVALRGFTWLYVALRGFTWLRMPQKSEHFKCS